MIMHPTTHWTRSTPDVWAAAYLSKDSEKEIHNFFVNRVGLRTSILKSKLHVTVYYARRALSGLIGREEKIDIKIDPTNLRFMPMAPGGENPRSDIDIGMHEIGVRIKRGTPERLDLERLRANFYAFETPAVLEGRRASTNTRNAFGARNYQPHITLLKKGCRIEGSLRNLGEQFRMSMTQLRLDRFVIRTRARPLLPIECIQ